MKNEEFLFKKKTIFTDKYHEKEVIW